MKFEHRDKYMEIGLKISYYRKMKGLTQEQLAEKAGISRGYISHIEAPNIYQPVSLDLLFDIAKALDIKSRKLLEFDNE